MSTPFNTQITDTNTAFSFIRNDILMADKTTGFFRHAH